MTPYWWRKQVGVFYLDENFYYYRFCLCSELLNCTRHPFIHILCIRMSKSCGKKVKELQQIFEKLRKMRAKVAENVLWHTAIQISFLLINLLSSYSFLFLHVFLLFKRPKSPKWEEGVKKDKRCNMIICSSDDNWK